MNRNIIMIDIQKHPYANLEDQLSDFYELRVG